MGAFTLKPCYNARLWCSVPSIRWIETRYTTYLRLSQSSPSVLVMFWWLSLLVRIFQYCYRCFFIFRIQKYPQKNAYQWMYFDVMQTRTVKTICLLWGFSNSFHTAGLGGMETISLDLHCTAVPIGRMPKLSLCILCHLPVNLYYLAACVAFNEYSYDLEYHPCFPPIPSNY